MTLSFLTAGESHGKAGVGIIQGIPAGLEINTENIHSELKRRKLGYGRGNRQKIEDDSVEILSGVRHGKTLGSPITLMIRNKDWKNWEDIMRIDSGSKNKERLVTVPRPGHADLVGGLKYAHEDMRNILERSSARETAIRVGLGSVARTFLEAFGIGIASRVIQIGSVSAPLEESVFSSLSSVSATKKLNDQLDKSNLRCLDKNSEDKMILEIDRAKKTGDTLGGIFEVVATTPLLGLGSYSQWDERIEGEIAKAFMSLNAIKGVEIGDGFELAKIPGSQAHDAYFPKPKSKGLCYKTNHAGGITGGMTTGQSMLVRAAMKPISTLMNPLPSVELKTGKAKKAHVERSDTCAVPAAAVICESLLALVLANAVLEKFGGDSMKEILPRIKTWRKVTQIYT